MKLIFASPTYGPVDPQAIISQRCAIMHAAANGHTWLGDASPDRMKFEVARNTIAQAAIDTGADAVFWCDSDVILPTYTVTRLAAYGKDFITGIYFQRNAPHWPLMAAFTGQTFRWYVRWEEDVLAAIDGCGFGCVLTSVPMLKKMAERFQGKEDGWFCYKKFSEDFDFCLRAKEVGYQLWADTGVICGHLQDAKPVTAETYQKEHPELFTGGDNGTAIQSSNQSSNADVAEDRSGRPTEADISESEIQPSQL